MESDLEKRTREKVEKKWLKLKEISFRSGMFFAALEERFEQEYGISSEEVRDEESCSRYLNESLVVSLIRGYVTGKKYSVDLEFEDFSQQEQEPEKENAEIVPDARYL